MRLFHKVISAAFVILMCACLCSTGLAAVSGSGTYDDPYVTGGGGVSETITVKDDPNDFSWSCFVKGNSSNEIWLYGDCTAEHVSYDWTKSDGNSDSLSVVHHIGSKLYQFKPGTVYLVKRDPGNLAHFEVMAPVTVTVSYDLNGGSVGGGAPGFTLYCLDGGDYAVSGSGVKPFTSSNPKYLEQASPKKDEKPLQYWESNNGVRMKYGDAFNLKALTKGLTSPDIVLKAIYDLPPVPPQTGDGFPLIPMAALACAAVGCILLIAKRRA